MERLASVGAQAQAAGLGPGSSTRGRGPGDSSRPRAETMLSALLDSPLRVGGHVPRGHVHSL